MTARIYAYHSGVAVLWFSSFYLLFLSVGCHMEEGQILFDFLLAMIPIQVPVNFETH